MCSVTAGRPGCSWERTTLAAHLQGPSGRETRGAAPMTATVHGCWMGRGKGSSVFWGPRATSPSATEALSVCPPCWFLGSHMC